MPSGSEISHCSFKDLGNVMTGQMCQPCRLEEELSYPQLGGPRVAQTQLAGLPRIYHLAGISAVSILRTRTWGD